MKKQVHLGIGIPCSTSLWQSEFGMSMINLVTQFMRQPVPGYARQQLSVLSTKTSLLPKARHELVQRSIERGCTHLLFIDTDQTFPAWTAHALLSRNVPVIGANVATKCVPSGPTARLKSDKWVGGDKLFTMPNSSGIEKVWRVGTGVLLIDLSIFDKLSKPWFSVEWRTWDEGKEDILGEDWYLMEKIEKAGFDIYVDHDVSKHVGHIGNFEYTHAMVWAEDMVKEIQDGEAEISQERQAATGGA